MKNDHSNSLRRSVVIGVAGLAFVTVAGCAKPAANTNQPQPPVATPLTPTNQPTNTPPDSSNQNSNQATTPPPSPAPALTMAVVAQHSGRSSCYSAINGSVYDLTSWIDRHPGGPERILSICGRDGSSAFANQHEGEPRPEQMLASFRIGALAQ